MSCGPIRQRIGPLALATLDNVRGLQSAQATRFIVWGFDPRLDVAVMVYWQQTTPTGILPTNGAANDINKISARAVSRDGRGTVTDLNAIYSTRNLPDGYEFQTAAQGVAFDLTNVQYTTNVDPKDDATLWLLVEAAPSGELPGELAKELLSALSVDIAKTLLLQQLT